MPLVRLSQVPLVLLTGVTRLRKKVMSFPSGEMRLFQPKLKLQDLDPIQVPPSNLQKMETHNWVDINNWVKKGRRVPELCERGSVKLERRTN